MKALLILLCLVLIGCGDDAAVSEDAANDGTVGKENSEGKSTENKSKCTGKHKGDCKTKPVESDVDDDDDDKEDDD